jgi:hypothetical protein
MMAILRSDMTWWPLGRRSAGLLRDSGLEGQPANPRGPSRRPRSLESKRGEKQNVAAQHARFGVPYRKNPSKTRILSDLAEKLRVACKFGLDELCAAPYINPVKRP